MEEKTHRVLVVEDDADLLDMHSLHLISLGYDVLSAENGAIALELVKGSPESIDIILADIVMPVMEGYAFCQAVKSDFESQDIPFIFISSLISLEEKLKGFEVGADDYIAKPISPEELGLKIKKLLELRAENKELQQQLSESNSVAMQAMTYSSDLGQVLEFYKNTLDAVNFEEIARLLFDVTNNYGLKCSLKIFTRDKAFSFSSQGVVSPLEESVIDLSRSKGRFFDFNARTIINYADFSLLVKNMPIEAEERYGIMKDSLGNLCDAVEARVKFLMYENASIQKEQIINAVIGMMDEVDKQFGEMQEANTNVINSMLDNLDEAMLDLGLTPAQEDLVRAIVVEGRERSKRTLKRADVIYDKFEAVKTELDNALENK